MSELVCYSVAESVATISLNRPHRRNALVSDLLDEIGHCLDDAVDDPGVRVIVLTGQGGAFSSGLDLSAVDPQHDDLGALLEERYRPIIQRLADCPKVTIAALPGPAAGAGTSLMLACDLVVATDTAFVQIAFINIGLIPDAGATWYLPRCVGMKRALAWALTGNRITARDAQAAGLVYQVFPDEEFATATDALAKGLAAKSLTACRLIKSALRVSLENDLTAQFEIEERFQSAAGRTNEFKTAVEAFLKKR